MINFRKSKQCNIKFIFLSTTTRKQTNSSGPIFSCLWGENFWRPSDNCHFAAEGCRLPHFSRSQPGEDGRGCWAAVEASRTGPARHSPLLRALSRCFLPSLFLIPSRAARLPGTGLPENEKYVPKLPAQLSADDLPPKSSGREKK